MEKSAIEQAVDKSGGLGSFALSVGVTYQAVQRWCRSKKVPAERVLRVEQVSGVSRSELRPDLYPDESRLKTKRKTG